MNEQTKNSVIGQSQIEGIGDWDIDFVVPGDPVALKRHRTFKRGEFTGSYDPSKGDKAAFLAKALSNKPIVPLDESLFLKLEFHFPRPKSHYRTGKNSHILKDSAPVNHTGTPDADNLAKFVCDSLNGIFWTDDKIVSQLHVTKIYDQVPHVRIQIFRLNKLKALELWETEHK